MDDPYCDGFILLFYFFSLNLLGISGRNLHEVGIPSMEELVAEYCTKRGIPMVPTLLLMPFYMAFSFFRVAAILQGVYKRSLQGEDYCELK